MATRQCCIIFAFITLMAAVALIAASVIAPEWISSSSVKAGLWRSCTKLFTEVCFNRNSVFEFEGLSETDDITLLLLICGGGLSVFALLTILISICSKQINKVSICLAGVFAILGGAAGLAGTAYIEDKVMKNVDIENRGWCNYAAYVGSILAVLGGLFTICSLCIRDTADPGQVRAYAMQNYPQPVPVGQTDPAAYQGYGNAGYAGPEVKY